MAVSFGELRRHQFCSTRLMTSTYRTYLHRYPYRLQLSASAAVVGIGTYIAANILYKKSAPPSPRDETYSSFYRTYCTDLYSTVPVPAPVYRERAKECLLCLLHRVGLIVLLVSNICSDVTAFECRLSELQEKDSIYIRLSPFF